MRILLLLRIEQRRRWLSGRLETNVNINISKGHRVPHPVRTNKLSLVPHGLAHVRLRRPCIYLHRYIFYTIQFYLGIECIVFCGGVASFNVFCVLVTYPPGLGPPAGYCCFSLVFSTRLVACDTCIQVSHSEP